MQKFVILAREGLGTKGLIVCDQNNGPLAEKKSRNITSKGCNIKVCILNDDSEVKPDESSITHILLELILDGFFCLP